MTLILSKSLPTKWTAGMAWCETPRENTGARSLFRHTVEMDTVPDTCRVFVTADSRYRLFVNGVLVGRGPLKGTLHRYPVEEYDLAPYLRPGKNVIAADVLWFGVNAPLSEEHSGFAGFLLQSSDSTHSDWDTPGGWKASGEANLGMTWDRTGYTSNAHIFIAGMEHIQAAYFPHEFSDPDFDDSHWQPAILSVPLDAGGGDGDAGLVWNFVPRDVPALIEEARRFTQTIEEMRPVTHRFGEEPTGWDIPAGESGEIVLNVGCLTTGFPVFHFDGGAGRTVEIIYGECVLQKVPGTEDDTRPYLWGARGRLYKGVRDALDNGVIHGYRDTVELSGKPFLYEPHHWRTFWYVQINVTAGATDFRLADASYRFTTYPQILRATFAAPSEPDMNLLWETSWRTLQLCSHETYEDCPGYEQLNYLFDARNEALTSLVMTGDGSLPRRTITLFRDTLRPDGMLSSRTPSQLRQTIPIFALWWIQMVQDYWDWFGTTETGFVRGNLIAMDAVLSFFRQHLRDDGFVGVLPYWNPIGGEDAPGSDLDTAISEGGSTYVTALYRIALEIGQRLHREVGYSEDAGRWEGTVQRVTTAIESAWSEPRGVFVESLLRPDAPVSQHTQATVILSGIATPSQVHRIISAIQNGVTVAPMTRQQGLPFAQAMLRADRYDIAARQYLREYREQLSLHLSTWVEGPLEGRSDCHAWSAWLPIELLMTVLGIRPQKPGFAEIRIAPEPFFPSATGTLSTPVGEITVTYTAPTGEIARLHALTPHGVPVTVQLPGRAAQQFPSGGEIIIGF